MTVIRFARVGKKKYPFYHIIVSDQRSPRDSNYIEKLGYYNPISKDFKLNKDRTILWLSKGSQIFSKLKKKNIK